MPAVLLAQIWAAEGTDPACACWTTTTFTLTYTEGTVNPELWESDNMTVCGTKNVWFRLECIQPELGANGFKLLILIGPARDLINSTPCGGLTSNNLVHFSVCDPFHIEMSGSTGECTLIPAGHPCAMHGDIVGVE